METRTQQQIPLTQYYSYFIVSCVVLFFIYFAFYVHYKKENGGDNDGDGEDNGGGGGDGDNERGETGVEGFNIGRMIDRSLKKALRPLNKPFFTIINTANKIKSSILKLKDIFNPIINAMKCGVRMIENLPKCMLFYLIDCIGYIMYFPIYVIIWIFTLEYYEKIFWKGVNTIDRYFHDYTTYHLFHYSDYIQNMCYRCNKIKAPKPKPVPKGLGEDGYYSAMSSLEDKLEALLRDLKKETQKSQIGIIILLMFACIVAFLLFPIMPLYLYYTDYFDKNNVQFTDNSFLVPFIIYLGVLILDVAFILYEISMLNAEPPAPKTKATTTPPATTTKTT